MNPKYKENQMIQLQKKGCNKERFLLVNHLGPIKMVFQIRMLLNLEVQFHTCQVLTEKDPHFILLIAYFVLNY